MTSDVSSLLSQIQGYIKTDSDGNTTYSLSDVSKLETLFEDTDYYNAGEAGQTAIQDQIDDLEKVIETLQKEADELQAKIDDKSLDVDAKCDELADIASDINSETSDYQKDIKTAAKTAAREAILTYSNSGGGSFEECFSQAFAKKIGNISGVNMNAISDLYADYDVVKNEISGMSDTIQGLLNDVKGLQNELNLTNSTINLLTTTKNNMSDTIKGAYSNVDTDTKIPTYSGAKAELADTFLGTYTSRYDSTGATSTSTELTQAQSEALSSLLGTATATYSTSDGDKYNPATNAQLAELDSVITQDVITSLQNEGLSSNQILDYIIENYPYVGISYDESTNTYKIPYGHGTDKRTNTDSAYSLLRNLMTTDTTMAKTADDVDQKQMEELKKAVETDDIITQMYESGYSFKEAMYLLTQLFPDAGITYNLSDQDGTKTYSRVLDSASSGSLYSTISAQILEYWNVDFETETTTDPQGGDNDSDTGGYDPITFQSGSTTYTFVKNVDDGTFDYNSSSDNDLLGSSKGIEELLEYDINGDGIIDDNDYTTDDDGNKVYALDQLTLMANNQIENYDGTTNSVDFDVTYTSARLAGITSIDLQAIKAMTSEETQGSGEDVDNSTKTYDNAEENFEDINGSSIINTFSINLSDGSTVTANETLNTEDNLNTFYKQIADNNTANIYSSIDETQFAKDTAEGNWVSDEAEALSDQFDNMASALAELKGKADADSDQYNLNYTYEQLVELYGRDGISGTYIDEIIESGEAASSIAEQAKHKNHDINDLESQASSTVGAEIDKINEKYEVKLTKEESEDTSEG